MSKQNDEMEQDDRFPSGPWRGFWLQDGRRAWMDIQLDFHNGQVSACGSDIVGEFAFTGTYNTGNGRVLITKQYLNQHHIQYEGWAELQHGIWGLWQIPPGHRGGWHIRPIGHGTLNGQETHAEIPRELVSASPVSVKGK